MYKLHHLLYPPPDLPSGDQLRHVRELSEMSEFSDDTPPLDATSAAKSLPPMLISDGLPPVPAKLVKKIQEGRFVEMAELLADTLISPEYAGDQNPDSNKRKPKEVTNIMDWVQCFGVFMAIISLKEPHRIPDLIGYQSLIIQSSLHCQEGRWVIYDRRFRLKASAVVILEWSCIDITVWKMAFPERPLAGGSYLPSKSLMYKPPQQPPNVPATTTSRICLAWNENPSPECLRPSCNFDHICYRCVHTNFADKKHKAIFCPHKQKRPRHLRSQDNTSQGPYTSGQ